MIILNWEAQIKSAIILIIIKKLMSKIIVINHPNRILKLQKIFMIKYWSNLVLTEIKLLKAFKILNIYNRLRII